MIVDYSARGIENGEAQRFALSAQRSAAAQRGTGGRDLVSGMALRLLKAKSATTKGGPCPFQTGSFLSGLSPPTVPPATHTHTHTMTNLNPKYLKSHVYGKYTPLAHTVEIFLDYNCPFSAKMFKKLQDEVIPLMEKKNLTDKYNIVFINVVQPWHGMQSSILHDVSFAVSKVKPEIFWDVSRLFFDNITQFYDTECYDKSRKEITDEVVQLASGVEGGFQVTETAAIKELLAIKGLHAQEKELSNAGNGVAKDNKYFARYQRTLGVHVTPSVLVNGIYMSAIESSTAAEKIIEIIENQCN